MLKFFILICSLVSYVNCDELEDYIEINLKDKKVCFWQNPGNAGDALIWYGTICLFNKLGINYIHARSEDDILSPEIDVVVCSGGGNFVPYYKNCSRFINRFMSKVKQIILLPHTIQGNRRLLKNLLPNVKLFCREKMSHEYCKSVVSYPENVFISDDMAFYADVTPFNEEQRENNSTVKDLFAFRGGREVHASRKGIKLPASNIDVSKLFGNISMQSSFTHNYTIVANFLNFISSYDIVWTDRLHVGIGAFLLGKKVHLFDNSYGKNRAVYENSIKPRDLLNQVKFYTNFEIFLNDFIVDFDPNILIEETELISNSLQTGSTEKGRLSAESR